MPKQSLVTRIGLDPAYTKLVRLVGYLGVPYPIASDRIEPLNMEFGKDKIIRASAELIESDESGTLAMLKPGIRRLCRALLGPAPVEWNEFYTGVENPPPNPYLSKPQKLEPPTAPTRRRKGQAPQKRSERPASESPEELRGLEGVELMRRYFAAKLTLEENDEHSQAFGRMKPEYDLLKAECLRRDISLPPTGYDGPAFPFTKHTTHRLYELLDMNQYELTRYPPDSVTYEEAARDIGFIETELRRRRPTDSARNSRSRGD